MMNRKAGQTSRLPWSSSDQTDVGPLAQARPDACLACGHEWLRLELQNEPILWLYGLQSRELGHRSSHRVSLGARSQKRPRSTTPPAIGQGFSSLLGRL